MNTSSKTKVLVLMLSIKVRFVGVLEFRSVSTSGIICNEEFLTRLGSVISDLGLFFDEALHSGNGRLISKKFFNRSVS